MKKQTKSLSVLVVTLALVIAALILFRSSPSTAPSNHATLDGNSSLSQNINLIPLIGKSIEEVQSVRIKTSADDFTITRERNDGGFVYKISDVDDGKELDTAFVEKTVRDIAGLSSVSVVDEYTDNLPQYGFDSPQAEVTVVFTNGDSKIVKFGAFAPLGKSVYVRLSDEKKVYLVASGSAYFINNAKENYTKEVKHEAPVE